MVWERGSGGFTAAAGGLGELGALNCRLRVLGVEFRVKGGGYETWCGLQGLGKN